MREYFYLEAGTPDHLEFRDGDVVRIPGGVRHSLIAANTSGELVGRLRETACRT